MLKKIFSFLDFRGNDREVMVLLAPVFALVTSVNVITISFSKSLFIASNPYSSLPWMFIGAGGFTMLATMVYVTLIQRWSSIRRFQGLLGIAVVSFLLIAALTPLNPVGFSLIVFAWCAGMGSLLMTQTWAWSSTLLPTRQAKRLFPISSALATLGAAVGGGLTKAMLTVGGMALLMVTAAVVLLLSFYFLGRAHRRIVAITVEESSFELQPINVQEMQKETGGISRLVMAFRALREVPLLGKLALLAFFIQMSSVLLDFQFSSALKQGHNADQMAGFFGIYYLLANLLTLGVALFLAGRFTQWFGIGAATSAVGWVLAIGSGAVVFFTVSGDVENAIFWGVVGTSFVERVAGFGVAKQAIQAAQMPVPSRYSEPSRFLIDGVMTRLAVILVSVTLLLSGLDLSDYAGFSPVILCLALLAVVVGFRVGKSYQTALLSVLTKGRGFAEGDIPVWARAEAGRMVGQSLRSEAVENIQRGLEMSRELKVPPPPRAVDALLRHSEDRLVICALDGLQDTDLKPQKDTMFHLIKRDDSPEILCGVLGVLPRKWEEFSGRVNELMQHADEAVSSRAVMWLRGTVLGPRTRQVIRRRVQNQTHTTLPAMPDDLTGETLPAAIPEEDLGPLTKRVVDLVDQLPKMLRSESPKMQRIALELFVELTLPEHVTMLLDAIEDPQSRSVAVMALSRMSRDVLTPELKKRLAPEADTSQATRIRLLQLLERIGGEEAMEMLLQRITAPSLPMRQQAVTSLWQLTGRTEMVLPSRDMVVERIAEEVDELVILALADSVLAERKGIHQQLLRTELALRRSSGEVRVFRLLALIYKREAIDRAFASFRSADPRQRSNAIELIDTSVTDQVLKIVVHYMEGTDYREGRSETSSTGMMRVPAFSRIMKRLELSDGIDPVKGMLANQDPRFYDLYIWAYEADARDSDDDVPATGRATDMGEVDHEDVMQRLFLLRGIYLFDGVQADQLLPLAQLAHRVTFAANSVIFEEDDNGEELYLVARGRVNIVSQENVVATLGPRECFGEMAILDQETRSARAMAAEETECLVVGRADFDDLLEIAPGLARGVIRVLTRRLRNTLKEAKTSDDS